MQHDPFRQPNPFQAGSVPPRCACKCCGANAELTGVVDFARCGYDVLQHVIATRQPVNPTSIVLRKSEPYAGWPVYYYRCGTCFFTFTRAFDDWTPDDFARHVYNDDYVRHDPDYAEARPQQYADLLTERFGAWKESLAILDYGSGSGLLERKLRARGFAQVQSEDPFTQARRIDSQFDLILCVEVFEHVLDPVGLLRDLKKLLRPGGAILLSTLCCTQEVIDNGIANWWYCVPRNGHISFYSPESLALLAEREQLRYGRLNESVHLMYHEQVPDWLRSFF
jgi:SAM-dependent methyltransferase